MDPHHPNPCTHCPDCGAPLKPEQTRCWLCQGKPAADAAGGIRPVDSRAGYQYSLSSLLLVMTLIAVLSSLIGMNPGMGIMVAVLALPALAWTCQIVLRRRRRGQSLTAGGKVVAFLLSLAMIVIVIVAAGAAFFVTCLTTVSVGGGGDIVLVAMIMGLVAGLAVLVLLARFFDKLSNGKPRRVPQPPARQHLGREAACPSCGRIISAYASTCPNCGPGTGDRKDRETA
jgi:hypothetical protein